jgi:hypothetical protein
MGEVSPPTTYPAREPGAVGRRIIGAASPIPHSCRFGLSTLIWVERTFAGNGSAWFAATVREASITRRQL